jgi:hypothetical protein
MDELMKTGMTTIAAVLVTGALAVLYRMLKKIFDAVKILPSVVESISVVSKNITAQNIASRYTIKAIRSHSYALREAGCNGSVTTALEHIGKAEDAINGRANENAEAAMHVDIAG